MSSQVSSRPATAGQREAGWASGMAVFASAVMIVIGVVHALAGIAAIIDDEVYVSTPNYIYAFDLTGWGWAHLVLGIVVAAAGIAILRGQTWARIVGIALASLSIIANFLFIPWYPIWSLVIIALDVMVIWALAANRRQPV